MKSRFGQRIYCFLATISILGGLLMPVSTQAKSSRAALNPQRLNTGVTAYAINLSTAGPVDFVKFSLNNPGALTAINTTNQYIKAATFLVQWPLRMFVLINSINTLSWIGINDGIFHTVGIATPQPGEVWSGLTASMDGTELYAISTTPNCYTNPGGHASLYSLNSNQGTATYIGAVSAARCLWGIAASPTVNEIFGVDVGLDNGVTQEKNHLIAFNPGTGNGSDLGVMGDSVGIPGGLTFERQSGGLYFVCSEVNDNLWHLFTLGNFYSGSPFLTNIGTFPADSDISAMAIPISDVPGLPPDKISPINGALAISTHPKLTWQDTLVSDSFEYCITTTSTLSGTDCDTGWQDIGLNIYIIHPSGLIPGQTYFWQVMASHPGGDIKLGNGGAWWSFTTATHSIFLPLVRK